MFFFLRKLYVISRIITNLLAFTNIKFCHKTFMANTQKADANFSQGQLILRAHLVCCNKSCNVIAIT
jgi:hypothetical protein